MTKPDRFYTAWPWLLLALLWVVALLNYLDRQVIFSIFPVLQTELHASSVELGLTSTVFLFTYAAFSPFAGYLADVFGRSRMIVISLAIWSLACFISSHAHSMIGVLGSRAAMGISEAAYIPAALAFLTEIHSEKSKSIACGIHQSGCYAGIIVGGTLGGMAGESFGWRPLFEILGVVGVAYAVFLWAVLRKRNRVSLLNRPTERLDISPLLRSAYLRIFTFVFIMYSIATWMIYTWLPLYLYQKFHISLAAAGFEATFWIQTASFAGALTGGFLADRPSNNPRRGRLLVSTLGLALAFPFLLILNHSNSLVIAALALITIGLGRGCFDANTAPILSSLVGPRLCSTSYGVINCAGSLIGGVGALAGGLLRQRKDLSIAFDVGGLALGLAVVGLFILMRNASTGLSDGSCVSQPSVVEG
jgi:MFS transporter, Spinster family, sphingosine-1-phosphate transporter